MILAIDVGTSGCTCMVFDSELNVHGSARAELALSLPRPGWVEQDLDELWETTRTVAIAALADAKLAKGELVGVGITNQRETVCAWERSSGRPLGSAIVWQDRRTAARCEELRAAGVEALVRERTGLVLDPYFSATKIEWMLDGLDGLRLRAQRGEALLGTVDAWLAFKLAGEHVTDASNASRTMLYDIGRGCWDGELLDLFGVPQASLPRVVASAGIVGEIKRDALDGHVAPLSGIAGDQQAALFGQGCVRSGMGKCTYGTGSFVLLNTGLRPPEPAHGVLGTVAWQLDRERTYALEAAVFSSGAAVQWLRDGLQIIESAAQSEAMAASLEGNDGVYFVPALTGLGSPHWDPHAKGTIVGLTRGSRREHLARATLEAMAYQTVDAVRAMEGASGLSLSELRADGGASANSWLMQFQADVLGVPVLVAAIPESTAVGAARLAGVGLGIWSVGEPVAPAGGGVSYEPRMSVPVRAELLGGWRQALAQTMVRVRA